MDKELFKNFLNKEETINIPFTFKEIDCYLHVFDFILNNHELHGHFSEEAEYIIAKIALNLDLNSHRKFGCPAPSGGECYVDDNIKRFNDVFKKYIENDKNKIVNFNHEKI